MPLRLDHVALAVHDAARVAAFYAVAGLGLARSTASLPACIRSDRGGIVLDPGGVPPSDTLQACVAGIAHVCIQSPSPERLWDELAAAGMRWNAELVGLGTGYLYAYGYDIEGNLVELEGVADAREACRAWLAHVAIVTPDIDRATSFYEQLIGTRSHGAGCYSHPNMGRIAALPAVSAKAAWIATPALTLELWQYVSPPTMASPSARPTGYRRLGFVCDDLPREADRLGAAGIPVVRTAAGLSGSDPDGNRFEVRLADPA